MAFRVSLPALNNNLVNLVKTTTQAIGIAVPELLYECVGIWNDYPSAQYPTMLLLFVSFILLVGVLVYGMHRWERRCAFRATEVDDGAARSASPFPASNAGKRPTCRSCCPIDPLGARPLPDQYLDQVGFSRWLASRHRSRCWRSRRSSCWRGGRALAAAQSKYTYVDAFGALWKWLPFLVSQGFLFNVIISLMTMLIGTAAGVAAGPGADLTAIVAARAGQVLITQAFRNSPWLVLLFIVLLALPFEIVIGGVIITIPDWMKAVFGLSLPIMANISEVVRGAIQSVPTGSGRPPKVSPIRAARRCGRSSCRNASSA